MAFSSLHFKKQRSATDAAGFIDPTRGLKSIALFEAAKGLLVLLIGFGLLSFIHRDLQEVGERIVEHLHLNPAHHYPRIFIDALGKVQGARLSLLIFGALIYASLRFVEAYGLWRDRAWAEWLAIVSCSIYLPVEFYDLWKQLTAVRVSVTAFNLGILLYLVQVRRAKMEVEIADEEGVPLTDFPQR